MIVTVTGFVNRGGKFHLLATTLDELLLALLQLKLCKSTASLRCRLLELIRRLLLYFFQVRFNLCLKVGIRVFRDRTAALIHP